MRKSVCDGLLLLSLAMIVFVIISKGFLGQLVQFAAAVVGMYIVLNVVRWVSGKIAPVIRVVVTLAVVGGMLWFTAYQVQFVGLDGVLVLAILLLFIWAVMCPTNPKRARA